jgi:hypothetical protein
METSMIERVQSSEGSSKDEYDIIRLNEPLPEGFEDNYWECVKGTLEKVFNESTTSADTSIEKLRDKLKNAPIGTRTVFYHAEPLEVAADLAGRREKPITPDEKKRYIEVRENYLKVYQMKSSTRPSEDDLSQTHPED